MVEKNKKSKSVLIMLRLLRILVCRKKLRKLIADPIA